MASRICVVSSWVQYELPSQTDYDNVPANIIFGSLCKLMEQDYDKLLRLVPSIDFNTSDRYDLLPSGDNLVEQYTDYKNLRYEMINTQRRLVGEAGRLPEFQDHPVHPPDPIELPSGVMVEPKISALEKHLAMIEDSMEAIVLNLEFKPIEHTTKQTKQIKSPTRIQFEAYRISTLIGGTQKDVAEKLSCEHDKKYDQYWVSRAIKAVKEYIGEGGQLPELNYSKPQTITMNPSKIEIGNRPHSSKKPLPQDVEKSLDRDQDY